MKYLGIALLAIVPFLAIGAVLGIVNGQASACHNVVNESVEAPDGRHTLIVFSRQCGERSAPNTQAALVPKGGRFKDGAETFLPADGKVALQPHWIDGKNLELSLASAGKVRLRKEMWEGVHVAYH